MNGLAILGQPTCHLCRSRTASLARFRICYSTDARSSPLAARRPNRALRTQLPDKPARTRFAPSPTGYLHLGSLRTALYNYLLARATNGQFVLRLEDTDQSRIVPDAETRLYEDLKWSGLSWDEGPDCGGLYGPYKQSERLHMYKDFADRLIQDGKAFRCFCSHDDITTHHQKSLEADGMFGTYPGMCLSIPADESAERAANGAAHTIRFRSSPDPVMVHDIVYGVLKKRLPEDHFIIMKSDGFPTYHFANVVDDHLMDITHVVRGAEWLISTAKHVSLYDALGWEPPRFAHVGLLVDSNRQKLSKRNMDIGIDSYMREGIPPPALLNFAVLLGWNPGNSPAKGVMTLDDMVKNFDLRFTKGDIIVNVEKLSFLHKRHIRLALANPSAGSDLVEEYVTKPVLRKAGEIEAQRKRLPVEAALNGSADRVFLASLGEPMIRLSSLRGDLENDPAHKRIRAMLQISRSEATTASGIIEANRYLIWQPSSRCIKDSYSSLSHTFSRVFIDKAPKSVVGVLNVFIGRLDRVNDANWKTDVVQGALDDAIKCVVFCEEGETPAPVGYKVLRWALLGLDNGPRIFPLIEYLGKAETIRRLELARAVADPNADFDLFGRRDEILPTHDLNSK